MDILELDIETFSDVELKKSNVYAYTESPEFEILMCAWSLNDSPIEVWEDEYDISKIPGLFDPDVKKVAHNAPFERICFSRLAGLPVGQYIEAEQYFDTMAIAREYGYPASLEALAKALGAEPKDTAGERLINLFCKPRKVPRKQEWIRVRREDKPIEWKQFRDYCGQDVSTLKDVRRRLPGWPSTFERELWYVDQRVNDRGWRVDLPLARKAVAAAKKNDETLGREVIEITGVENPNSTQQLGEWCASVDFPMENWQARTVEEALGRAHAYDRQDVVRVLELRQELALVAHRKYEAVLRGVSMDGRLRGQFTFHAAHTGRWSSRGAQVHNLPRLSFEYKDEEGEKHYDEIAEDLAIWALMNDRGCDPETLKKLVRPTFLLDGTTSDFSAIEARVLAWLAGEDWVLRAFEEGRDLYVETADRMGGMSRQQGKIAVLACGYQGSVGSMRNMGYGGWPCPWDIRDSQIRRARMAARDKTVVVDETNDEPRLVSEGHKCNDEIQVVVDAWRAANPRIVNYWKRLEQAFRHGGKCGRITVLARGSQRRVVLPSGRTLYYHGVSVGRSKDSNHKISYRHVKGYREGTYGGRLTENVTQAVARDLLAHALINLDHAGYPIVGHVHDEALSESKDTEGIREIMRTGPEWAEGLPLDASADILYRYRKD